MSNVVSRIEKEYIFNFLIQNKVQLEIQCGESKTEAVLDDQNASELKIELTIVLEEMLGYNVPIKVVFFFQNNFHTFNSTVIKIKNNIAIIKNPENIIKNLQRKYERVEVKNGLKVQFEIRGDLLPLDFPESKVYYYPERPPISADFSDVKIETIIGRFREKMDTQVSYNKIVMLRNKRPRGFDEKLMIKYGRIVWIPNTHSELPQKQISPELQVVLKHEWVDFEQKSNKTKPFLVHKILSDYLLEKSRNDILSMAMVPVLYRQYVVGIIHLINNHQKNAPVNVKILNYASRFSRILSFTLKENGYFLDEEANTKEYQIPIFDISPGGLGFFLDDDYFEDKLLLNHNIRFLVQIDNRPVRILAKLVRKFKHLSRYGYGFMFIDMKKVDFDFMNQYLYHGNKNEQ
jgi:hypothetical protein